MRKIVVCTQTTRTCFRSTIQKTCIFVTAQKKLWTTLDPFLLWIINPTQNSYPPFSPLKRVKTHLREIWDSVVYERDLVRVSSSPSVSSLDSEAATISNSLISFGFINYIFKKSSCLSSNFSPTFFSGKLHSTKLFWITDTWMISLSYRWFSNNFSFVFFEITWETPSWHWVH